MGCKARAAAPPWVKSCYDMFMLCLVWPGEHFTVYIRPTETEFSIKDLTRGTSYHAYLEAIFDKNIAGKNTNILKSWILIAITRGIGPDNRTCQIVYYLITSSL